MEEYKFEFSEKRNSESSKIYYRTLTSPKDSSFEDTERLCNFFIDFIKSKGLERKLPRTITISLSD